MRTCPYCGDRDAEEFSIQGEAAGPRPIPRYGCDGCVPRLCASARQRYGPTREYWYHAAGCRRWLTVSRDTRDHEILGVALAKSRRHDPAGAGRPDRPQPENRFPLRRQGFRVLPATRWPRRCWPMAAAGGRSFKYHRPRGIFTAGAEEPNALVELRRGARREPNTRATTTELFEGLEAQSQNRFPSLSFDLLSVNNLLSPFLPRGFLL